MAKKNYKSDQACVPCKRQGEGMVCFHHLFTRKVYPEFEGCTWNQIPVCQECHNRFHNKGISYMANKYLSVHFWLVKNEWFFCETVKKWRRDGF